MKRTTKLALTILSLALVSPLYAEAPPSVATPTAETATDYSLVIDDQGDVSIPGSLTVGDIEISGSLEVPTIAGDSTTVTGDLTIDKNLSVTGTATFPTIAGDTTTMTGDLTVNQDLTAKGDVTITGLLTFEEPSFFYVKKEEGNYMAHPLDCLELCWKNHARVATVSEAYEYAATGGSICSYLWLLDDQNPGCLATGFPMFENRTSKGCGTQDTGNVPRIAHLKSNLAWCPPGGEDTCTGDPPYGERCNNCGCYRVGNLPAQPPAPSCGSKSYCSTSTTGE